MLKFKWIYIHVPYTIKMIKFFDMLQTGSDSCILNNLVARELAEDFYILPR